MDLKTAQLVQRCLDGPTAFCRAVASLPLTISLFGERISQGSMAFLRKTEINHSNRGTRTFDLCVRYAWLDTGTSTVLGVIGNALDKVGCQQPCYRRLSQLNLGQPQAPA